MTINDQSLAFIPFDFSDEHYAIIIANFAAVLPDDQEGEEDMRYSDQTAINEKRYWHRFIGMIDGKPVGHGYYCETWWNELPDDYRLKWFTHPDYFDQGHATAFYDWAIARIYADRGKIQTLSSSAQDDQTRALKWLQNQNYTEKERYPRSELQIADIDPDMLPRYQNRMAEQGIKIQPLTTLMTTDPAWKTKLWELDWILDQDEPGEDPPTRKTLEEYENEEFNAPYFSPEAWMIATDAEMNYAGLTVLYKDKVVPGRLYTGWTGVDRPYRKMGVATALKLHAFDWAKTNSYTHIRTDNHETNHMYQINLTLGFKPIPAIIGFTKSMP